ncbi:MAG: methyltransferase domain-containing protein [Salinibacterium sp.]|nr:class I SAM-dependent methyltransferase [Salinibacterium sp.]MBF0672142.1 methyltransferase domain-containing protein [Salinibacterium sp.]
MSISDTLAAAEADRELKKRHRAMWAFGDYPRLVEQIVHPLGAEVVLLAGVGSGDVVLDVAAGTGNAAVPAARLGARVTASDLTPELLTAGRAAAHDLAIDWVEADAEQLPFDAAGFDVVLSSIGVMFAPHHRAAASELLRVCRIDGTIGLSSWTPEGFVGRLFATMKPFAPAPPPGAEPPPAWGSPAHLDELFGARVETLRQERRMLPVTLFHEPEEFRDYFKQHYGPSIAVYRTLADDPVATTALDDALTALAREHALPGAEFALEWEYLVTVMRRVA